MSNEPLFKRIRDAQMDLDAHEKYAGATVASLPELLRENPEPSPNELHAIRTYVIEDLARLFPAVFDPDAMKEFYQHLPSADEVDEARKRVFKNLGWDEKRN